MRKRAGVRRSDVAGVKWHPFETDVVGTFPSTFVRPLISVSSTARHTMPSPRCARRQPVDESAQTPERHGSGLTKLSICNANSIGSSRRKSRFSRGPMWLESINSSGTVRIGRSAWRSDRRVGAGREGNWAIKDAGSGNGVSVLNSVVVG